MSINPFDDPSAGLPADEVKSLAAALAAAEFRAQHLEPVVRDLNRHLVDLIGQCPNTACGNWVTLDDGESVTFHLDVADVLRLSTAFQDIGRVINLESVRRSLPTRQSVHHFLVETVERVRNQGWGESIHLNVRKPFGFFGKGR